MDAAAYAALSVDDVKAAVESGDLTVADALRLEAEVGKERKGVLALANTGEPSTGDARDTPAALRRLRERLAGGS